MSGTILKIKQWLLHRSYMEHIHFFFKHNETPQSVQQTLEESYKNAIASGDFDSIEKTLERLKKYKDNHYTMF